MSEGTTGFEAAFKLVGGHGRFQFLCMALGAWQLLMTTWNHMGYIFIGAVPDHWCHIQELDESGWTVEQIRNISIPKRYFDVEIVTSDGNLFTYDSCHQYKLDYKNILTLSKGDFDSAYELAQELESDGEVQECHSWTYDKSIYESTVVTEFDLVCGRRYMVASIQSFYMIGAFIGNLVLAPLNDKFLGRRRTTLGCIGLVIIGGYLSSFATSFSMFIAMRFITAIGTAGCMQAINIWFLEHCDTKTRAQLFCIAGIFFGIGYAVMPIYAYFIRNWSHLQLAFSMTTTSLVAFYWLFPESPRWLASKGKEEEALMSLERFARVNGKPKPDRSELLKIIRDCYDRKSGSPPTNNDGHLDSMTCTANNSNQSGSTPNQNGCRRTWKLILSILRKFGGAFKNFKQLVATKELRRISFTIWFLFGCIAFVYYGFAFSTKFTNNPYLLVALGALMEIPSALLLVPLLPRFGRRPTLMLCLALSGISILSIAFTPAKSVILRTVLSMSGKLFISGAFTAAYLTVSEVFPTVVRTTGQASASLMGRIGSMAAPFAADLLTIIYPDLPLIIFGVISVAACFVAVLFPEMMGVDMKDQVYQLKGSTVDGQTKESP